MKILFLTDAIGYRGKERRLTDLLIHLSKDSNIKIGLVIFGTNYYFDTIFNYNIEIFRIERKFKKDITVFLKLFKIIRSFKPNIINSWGAMTSIYSIPFTIFTRIKLIDSLIADASPDNNKAFTKSWFYKKIIFLFADKLTANSFAGLNLYKVPINKRLCIHNGFDFNRLNNGQVDSHVREYYGISTEFIVGMVAYFCKEKDYKTYIESARKICKERDDVTFLAIGDGPYLSEMKKYANDMDPQKFIFTGKIKNIENVQKEIDIGILSTFSEGISNSIMEFMALEKPVIATDGGGTNELVQDNKTGFLVRDKCPNLMAEKIEYILNNKDVAYKMGKAAKTRIKSEFSISKMVASYDSLYKSLL